MTRSEQAGQPESRPLRNARFTRYCEALAEAQRNTSQVERARLYRVAHVELHPEMERAYRECGYGL